MEEANIEILKDQNEEDIEKRKRKIQRDIRIIILILILLILFLIFTLGTGFALLNILDYSNQPTPVQKTGVLEVEYVETDMFNITNAISMTDDTGLETKPLQFKLTNTGTTDLTYKVILVPLTSEIEANKLLSESLIRYQIQNNKNEKNNIATFESLQDDILFSGDIATKETINFDLRVWLGHDNNYNFTDKSYLFKMKIEAGI